MTSEDVNAYLREISGEDYTAKDFRTWAGTVLALVALREFAEFDSAAQAKKNIVRAVESVAKRLGNTPAICRKCYIHPAVIDSYLEGTMLETLRQRAAAEMKHLRGLSSEEVAVLVLLEAPAGDGKQARPGEAGEEAKSPTRLIGRRVVNSLRFRPGRRARR